MLSTRNASSTFYTSRSFSVSGMNGGTTRFSKRPSQSIPLKKGCYFMSTAPASQQPILSSGSCLRSFYSKSIDSGEQVSGIYIRSPALTIAFILSTIDISFLNRNGLVPVSISKSTSPNANQSTELL